VNLPAHWPELTLALALALLVAYVIADRVARVAWSVLHAIIEERDIHAQFVDRPRRIVQLVVFLVTAAALVPPALQMAGYRLRFGGNPDALLRWFLDAGLRIVIIATTAYFVLRTGSAAARRFEREMSRGTGLNVVERTKRAQTLGRLLQKALSVLVIGIAYGPDSDQGALVAISAVTGGTAYAAKKPADVHRVFLDATGRRSCRPGC